MNINELYIQYFLNEIEKYSETNKILVLLGAPPDLKTQLQKDHFIDYNTFLDEKGIEFFNKDWFTKSFAFAGQQKGYTFLSYAQFTSFVSYISFDFFGDRFVLIKDNLRKIFPIKEEEFKEAASDLENIEERPENLPAHHAEQIKIDGKYYYVLQEVEHSIETTSLFHQKNDLKSISNKNLKILDNGIDKYAVDHFINNLFEEKSQYKSIAVKLNRKYPFDTTQYEQLAHILAEIDVDLYAFEEKSVLPEVEIKPSTSRLLKSYWGDNAKFRDITVYDNPNIGKDKIQISQGQIVQTIISEIENARIDNDCRDLFLTAPTGSGKSLLFQLPAFYASERNMMTIVISPLIALMKDQVGAIIKERQFEKIAYLNSELTLVDREKILDKCYQGEIDILYLSPELLLSYDLSHFIGERKLGLMVIDEAHLITTWGRDFRVDYWFLGNHIRKMKKNHGISFPLVAVTATAIFGGENDMVFDSLDNLYMSDPHMFIGEVKRTDIEFVVNNYEDFDTKYEKQKITQTANFIKRMISETRLKMLVYAPYTNHVKKLVNLLGAEGIEVKGYYGSMDKDLKQFAYDEFLTGNVQAMVSTKAFGMGVDIPDIQVVYHHAPSGLLPDYIQEVGRLARKKELKGYAALNYSSKDQRFSKVLHGISALRLYQLKQVLAKISKTYKANKKRNILLSVEDFAFIFHENDNLDQKVLTSLMMIEKDYLNKYRFNVLLARPKKLFVKVYGRLSNEDFLKLQRKYRNLIEWKASVKNGDQIVEISLDLIWERHFSQKSFPWLKREYYQDRVFKDDGISVVPQVKAEFELSLDKNIAAEKFKNFLDLIRSTLSRISGYFSDQDFIAYLNKSLNDLELSLKLGKYLLATYSGNMIKPGVIESSSFLQKRRVGGKFEYQVFSNRYLNEMATMERLYGKLFQNSKKADRFLTKDESSAYKYSRLGYLLELLELGSFELKGGDNPMVFVRLNDPLRVEIDSRSPHYENTILIKTLDRHKISSRIFDHFFLRAFENEVRWEFIEDYFLGADADALIEKYPGEENLPVDIVNQLSTLEIDVNGDSVDTNSGKSGMKNNNLFPPDSSTFYTMDRLLSIKKGDVIKTQKISQWLTEDPVLLDRTRQEFQLKVNSDVYKILMSKLRSVSPKYYTRTLGLKKHIQFSGNQKTIRAAIPYNDHPVKFYKWWLKNPDEVYMTFEERVKLFLKVAKENQSILAPKHRGIIS